MKHARRDAPPVPTLDPRIPLAALLLLTATLALPAAGAQTCVGGAFAVCVHTRDCQAVTVRTPATDFYPGAGSCPATPYDDGACRRLFAGIATLGGYAGLDARACFNGDSYVACVMAYEELILPICV